MEWELYLTLARMCVALVILVVVVRRGWPLAVGIFLSGFILAVSAAMTPWRIVHVFRDAVTDEGMFSLVYAIASIYMLSGAMDKSGQNRRMMDIVARAIPSRTLQLILFPALIGVFPIPGGAIFTCPLVDESAYPLSLKNEHKALLNYWFRHISEVVTPLSPGIILFAALGDCSFPVLLLLGVPVSLWVIFVGYFFFLRKLPRNSLDLVEMKENGESLPRVNSFLWESLPLLVGLAVALILRQIFPALNAGFSIAISFALGTFVCQFQNHLPLQQLWHMLVCRPVLNNMLIVLGIFFFKEVLKCGDMMKPIGALAEGNEGLFLICILAPMLCGLLTGLFVGCIGICAPIILSVIQHAGAWDERIVWIALAVMFSYIAEQLSPMHVCLVVTTEYFHVSLSRILGRMLVPMLVVALGGTLWFWLMLQFA